MLSARGRMHIIASTHPALYATASRPHSRPAARLLNVVKGPLRHRARRVARRPERTIYGADPDCRTRSVARLSRRAGRPATGPGPGWLPRRKTGPERADEVGRRTQQDTHWGTAATPRTRCSGPTAAAPPCGPAYDHATRPAPRQHCWPASRTAKWPPPGSSRGS